MADTGRVVSIVLFEGFELLDVFGPVELLAHLPERFSLQMLGPAPGPVASAQGSEAVATHGYSTARPADIVLVPGGIGTRRLASEPGFLSVLRDLAGPASHVTSVCTGSGVLAAAGLLDGYRATSNKRAFAWASSQGPGVTWVPEARWVEDRDRWTSSGVAAGMDMTLALIAQLHGDQVALGVADGIEYEWHRDPSWDPFAAKNGLVGA
jgi:transcriptional regulator GlxA family with amidase domain